MKIKYTRKIKNKKYLHVGIVVETCDNEVIYFSSIKDYRCRAYMIFNIIHFHLFGIMPRFKAMVSIPNMNFFLNAYKP
jgi:hypothetical protein